MYSCRGDRPPPTNHSRTRRPPPTPQTHDSLPPPTPLQPGASSPSGHHYPCTPPAQTHCTPPQTALSLSPDDHSQVTVTWKLQVTALPLQNKKGGGCLAFVRCQLPRLFRAEKNNARIALLCWWWGSCKPWWEAGALAVGPEGSCVCVEMLAACGVGGGGRLLYGGARALAGTHTHNAVLRACEAKKAGHLKMGVVQLRMGESCWLARGGRDARKENGAGGVEGCPDFT
jgi:hypothetical protein